MNAPGQPPGTRERSQPEPPLPARPPEDGTALLHALLGDPNRRFPKRPKLIGDVRVFRMPDGLGVQFHFGDAPVMLRGNMTDRILDFALPMLDGTRSVEGILAACPPDIPHSTLVKTLLLLHTKGLVTDAERQSGYLGEHASAATLDDALHRQLLFWGRHVDVTRAAASGEEIQRRLAGYRIVVVGTGIFGATTCDLLGRSGCSELRVLTWDDDGLLLSALAGSPAQPSESVELATTALDDAASTLRGWVDDADLVVTATRNAPAELSRLINRICLQHERRWLRANADSTRIDVGPYVDPFGSACYACLELRERSMQELPIEEHLNQQDLARERPAGETPPLGEALFAATLAASLLVGEVVRIATGIAVPTLLNAVVRVSPVTGEVMRNTILRVPRCPECFGGRVSPPVPVVGSE